MAIEENGKKKLNKKEVRNIAIAGAAGGVGGAIKGVGDSAFNNYKSYNKIRSAYINKHINEYIKAGIPKKEAYRRVIDDFAKKKISLSKVVPEYTGASKYRVADAYRMKAISEMPYKAIGGAMAGVPIGMLAYGQISNMIENLDKKKSNNMVYFEKVTKNK